MAYHQNGTEVLMKIFYLSWIKTKIKLYQQMYVKIINHTFHGNLPSGSWDVLCRQMDTYKNLDVLSVHCCNQFTALCQHKNKCSSLDICIKLPNWIFLHISIHEGSSRGNKYQITLHNLISYFLHIIKLLIQEMQRLFKEFKANFGFSHHTTKLYYSTLYFFFHTKVKFHKWVLLHLVVEDMNSFYSLDSCRGMRFEPL